MIINGSDERLDIEQRKRYQIEKGMQIFARYRCEIKNSEINLNGSGSRSITL